MKHGLNTVQTLLQQWHGTARPNHIVQEENLANVDSGGQVPHLLPYDRFWGKRYPHISLWYTLHQRKIAWSQNFGGNLPLLTPHTPCYAQSQSFTFNHPLIISSTVNSKHFIWRIKTKYFNMFKNWNLVFCLFTTVRKWDHGLPHNLKCLLYPFVRIVRAFLIEEQKIVVRVLKAQAKKPASS